MFSSAREIESQGAEERHSLVQSKRLEMVAYLAWLMLDRWRADQPAAITTALGVEPELVQRAIEELVADTRTSTRKREPPARSAFSCAGPPPSSINVRS